MNISLISAALVFSAVAIPAPAARILSPTSGATVTGSITLTAEATEATTVDYWVAGHSIVTGPLPAKPPYSATLNTALLWDGPIQVVAVTRDAAGSVGGLSAPLNLIIQNGSTRGQLLAPDVNRTLSGTVTWQVQVSDPRGIQSLIYIVDGKPDRPHYLNAARSSADKYDLDTTHFSNGTHYLSVEIVPNAGAYARGSGQIITQFTVNNGRRPLELRSSYRELYFQPGSRAPVQLTPQLIYTDRSTQTVSGASFQTDNPAVVNVTGAGLVTPGARQGIAHITIAHNGEAARVRVMNITSHAGFPHFTKDGRIVYDYEPEKSLWVRTLFFALAQAVSVTPELAGALHRAGVNALNTNVYSNPVDSGIASYDTWLKTAGAKQAGWLATSRNNGFAVVGTGDDIQRTTGERKHTVTSPWARSAIQYTIQQLIRSGNVVSLEMQDEVGGPIPEDFRQVMTILKSAPARPPMTWPPAGSQAPNIFALWMGDPSVSDYASLYWTYAFNYRPEFIWGNSMAETKTTLDRSILDKLPGIQIDKPVYMEVQAYTRAYFKHVAGDYFHPGLDEMFDPGTPAEETTAEVFYAAAEGMAGVRAYGYDGAPGSGDGLWANQRIAGPLDLSNKNLMQTGASPFGSYPEVKDRWKALSNAFNVIQILEPFMLSPQIHAADLGSDIVTGARELSNGAGRVLIAINMVDNLSTVRIDLNPYRYTGANSVTRYRVCGVVSAMETVPGESYQTVTMAPGEALIWVFKAPKQKLS